MILFTDRFETRPIYYDLNKNQFIFATEVKSIPVNDLDKCIDLNAVTDLLVLIFNKEFHQTTKNVYYEIPDIYISNYKNPIHCYFVMLMNEHGRRGTLGGIILNMESGKCSGSIAHLMKIIPG